MKTSKLETAHRLAKSHFQAEPSLRHVFLLEPVNEEDPREPIKLLEVVEGTLETGFEAVAFAPDPVRGVAYPSIIVEISPREFAGIHNGTVAVNQHNWRLAQELHAA